MLETPLRVFTLSLFFAAACGGGDGGMDSGGGETGGPDGGSDVVDDSAPRIVSQTPEPDAVGQRDDLVLSLSFSEAMDQASVEDALNTESLGAVSLEWSEAGDELTITPNSPLEYNSGIGNDPSVVSPAKYGITLFGVATDLAGNELGDSFTLEFTTLRSMETNVSLNQALTRSLTPSAALQNDPTDPLVVGDLASDTGTRALFTFDISALPSTAVEVSDATFATRQLVGDIDGLPYGNGVDDAGLGNAVQIDHVSFDALDNGAFNANQTAHAALGDFCVATQVSIEKDVSAQVDDDLQNRAARQNRSQYLLRFELDNDQDQDQDRVVISRDLSQLQITYLAE